MGEDNPSTYMPPHLRSYGNNGYMPPWKRFYGNNGYLPPRRRSYGNNDYDYGYKEEEGRHTPTRYQTIPSFESYYHSFSNPSVQSKGVYDSPSSYFSTSKSKERESPQPPRVKTSDIMCVMCEGRGHLAEICPNQYYIYEDVHPLVSEVLAVPCEEEEFNPIRKEEEIEAPSLPTTRGNHSPNIERSPFKSLATPWTDLTYMVPSSLPFLLQEDVEAKDGEQSKNSVFNQEKKDVQMEPLQVVESFVDKGKPVAKPSNCIEQPTTEPCKACMPIEEELRPRSNCRPSIKRSSLTSLATPWMDATSMVPSTMPFLLQAEVGTNQDETDEQPKTNAREVSLSPTQFILFPLLHAKFFSRVRESEVYEYAFVGRTRLSCLHHCSYSQFLLSEKHFVLCFAFVAKYVTCMSCSILKHKFRLMMGKTNAWKYIHGYSMELIMFAYTYLVSPKDVLVPHFFVSLCVDVCAPNLVLEVLVDSRSNLFEGGEDDVIPFHLEAPTPRRLPRCASTSNEGDSKELERINNNAYKLELPPTYGVHDTFNVSDLKPYLAQDEEDTLDDDSWSNHLQQGEDDVNPSHLEPSMEAKPMPTQEPAPRRITRSKAKELQQLLDAGLLSTRLGAKQDKGPFVILKAQGVQTKPSP